MNSELFSGPHVQSLVFASFYAPGATCSTFLHVGLRYLTVFDSRIVKLSKYVKICQDLKHLTMLAWGLHKTLGIADHLLSQKGHACQTAKADHQQRIADLRRRLPKCGLQCVPLTQGLPE